MHSARNASPLCTGVTTLTRGVGATVTSTGPASAAVPTGLAIVLAQLQRVGLRGRLVHREMGIGDLVHVPVRRVVVEVQGAPVDPGRTAQRLVVGLGRGGAALAQ